MQGFEQRQRRTLENIHKKLDDLAEVKADIARIPVVAFGVIVGGISLVGGGLTVLKWGSQEKPTATTA